MANRYYYACEVPAPVAEAWPYFEFAGEGWTLMSGGPREIGARRCQDLPGMGHVVDKLVAYSKDEDSCSMSYAIVNEDNFLGAKGYRGTGTLHRNTNDPSRSFLTYHARWDSSDKPVAQIVGKMMPAVFEALCARIAADVGGDVE